MVTWGHIVCPRLQQTLLPRKSSDESYTQKV